MSSNDTEEIEEMASLPECFYLAVKRKKRKIWKGAVMFIAFTVCDVTCRSSNERKKVVWKYRYRGSLQQSFFFLQHKIRAKIISEIRAMPAVWRQPIFLMLPDCTLNPLRRPGSGLVCIWGRMWVWKAISLQKKERKYTEMPGIKKIIEPITALLSTKRKREGAKWTKLIMDAFDPQCL